MSTIKRGLQVLLPADFPPVVVRSISEFAGCYTDDSLVGRNIRLSLHHGGPTSMLHDCYVLYEGPFGIIVHVAPGSSLQIPRSDIGGMRWSVDQDANPHGVHQLSPNWMSYATKNRHLEDIGTIDVHLGDDAGHSCHRRVRGLGLNETIAAPTRPPFFVYLKMHFPYSALRTASYTVDGMPIGEPEGYMREAAAYSALHLCQPAVAPHMYHASYHSETGSYCLVMEDLITMMKMDPAKHATDLKLMKQVFASLAVLHGRFLSDEPEDIDPKEASRKSVGFNKELLQAMVHPKIFYATWREAVSDDSLLPLLDDLYGIEKPTAEEAAEDEAPQPSQQPASSRPSTGRRPTVTVDPTFISPRSLTLIHGCIRPEHIKLTKDRRASPNVYLLDWKCSGIGPLEVDLIQTYLLIPATLRKDNPDMLFHLLHEYSLCLKIFYQKERDILDLLQCMRDVCLLMARSTAFDWNQFGAISTDVLLQLHTELCERTTENQLIILREKLSTMFD